MNKLKLLYDVVKTLRDKDVITGVATIEVKKDQGKIFYVKNQFEKNLVTRQTTATITSEVDYEGKKIKHQSTTELTNVCPCGGGMHHKRLRQLHHAGGGCGSIKAKLTKFTFALELLSKIKAEEQEDKTILVTLGVNEMPEEIKALIQERMSQTESHHDQDHCCFQKEFFSIEKGNVSLAISVTKEYEIEKIVITFDGVQRDEQNEQHILDVVAELQLNI